MTRIAICDDEARIRRQLADFLQAYAAETQRDFEILQFEDSNQLLRDYPANLDLLLLDIAMNGLDGVEAAGEVRRVDESVTIIFITSMANRAIDGYRVHAFGFIKKPVDREELRYQLEGALAQIDAKKAMGSYVQLRLPKGTQRLPVYEISYAEVRDHKLFVHVGAETKTFWLSMNELEEQLGGYGFFRPHSAYLVNYRYISHIGAGELTLLNGVTIPVSQHKRKKFLEQMSDYMRDMG